MKNFFSLLHRNSLCYGDKEAHVLYICIDGMRDQVGLRISINIHVSMRVIFSQESAMPWNKIEAF